MTKKIFFFDIDGTLTDRSTGLIVPSAQTAVDELRKAGHDVCLATGRAHYKAEKFRASHHFDHMVCNGGHGIVINGELKENRPIDYEKSLAIYRQALSLGYGVLAVLDDSQKVYASSFLAYEQSGLRKEPTTYIIDENFDPANYSEIYKLYISIPEDKENLLTLKDTVGHLRFQKEYLMFQPDDKLGGIMRMLDYLGGKPEDVIVFGDDYNDLVMFDDRFFKVAMGNGCDALKEKADYIADLNTNDGIYKTCRHHNWF